MRLANRCHDKNLLVSAKIRENPHNPRYPRLISSDLLPISLAYTNPWRAEKKRGQKRAPLSLMTNKTRSGTRKKE
jgi:hypothetical protein